MLVCDVEENAGWQVEGILAPPPRRYWLFYLWSSLKGTEGRQAEKKNPSEHFAPEATRLRKQIEGIVLPEVS